MTQADRERWDAKYRDRPVAVAGRADEWLIETVTGVPPGRALDLACGLGHNSIWLTQQGWQVDAVDISTVGLALAQQAARALGVSVNWIDADLDDYRAARADYNLILTFRFLDRIAVPRIVNESLRVGGLLVYETFLVTERERSGSHPRSAAWTLQPGELNSIFGGVRCVRYEECRPADRDVARLMAIRDE